MQQKPRQKSTVARYRDMGASEIEFHPDGSVKSVKFAGSSRAPEKVESTEDKIAKDKAKREPRVDAMELAERLMSDTRKGAENGKA